MQDLAPDSQDSCRSFLVMRSLFRFAVLSAFVAAHAELCSSRTTASDVARDVNLSGQVAVITGGDSELGMPVVTAFAEQGATVIIASHNLSKCTALAAKVSRETGANVTGMLLDLSSFASVRSFAMRFLSTFSQLHILVNNAGMAGNPAEATVDGFQMLFQVNYLSHFLLTELLLPALRLAGTSDRPARVVHVASTEHRIACEAAGWAEGCLADFRYLPPPPVVPTRNVTIHYKDGQEVRPLELYGFSKFLLMEHARELSRREAPRHLQVFSLTPGWVNTSLTRSIKMDSPVAKRKCGMQAGYPCPFTPEEGAAITTVCALRATDSGAYYSRIKSCEPDSIVTHGFEPSMGPVLYERSKAWANVQLNALIV